MDTMEYKGYRGAVRYSAEDRVFHGRILGIEDVVNFEGTEVEKLEKAFHEAVDDYLALCEKLGRDPDRAYSGRIPLRIDASLHQRVAIAADSEAKSVNAWIADTLEAATKPRRSDAVRDRGKKPAAARRAPETRSGTRLGETVGHRIFVGLSPGPARVPTSSPASWKATTANIQGALLPKPGKSLSVPVSASSRPSVPPFQDRRLSHTLVAWYRKSRTGNAWDT